MQSALTIAPNGWFDEMKASRTKYLLLGMVPVVDTASRRVFPEKKERAELLLGGSGSKSIGSRFMALTISPIGNGVNAFAHAQVKVDEARIACRLERYRLVHGSYPKSLDEPAVYGSDLPHDIMNGEPYHYRLNADGSFLLYSVAWNQKDDGGVGDPILFRDASDWVWFHQPASAKSK